MFDMSQKPTIIGLPRVGYEIAVGASAQVAMEAIQEALVRHMVKAMTARFVLEFGAMDVEGHGFHTGGVVGKKEEKDDA